MVVDHHIFSQADDRLLQACIHCGLCLTSCPTYLVNGKEADSPRGRLALMKSMDRELSVDPTGAFEHIDLCLGCVACQTACPSGVQYGHLLEQFRRYQRTSVQPLSRLQRLTLGWLTNRQRLGWLTTLMKGVQKTGLDRVARLLRLGPASLRFQLAGLPKLAGPPFSQTEARRQPAAHPEGKQQGPIALFTGCVMDHWYNDVHRATTRVLRWNGFDVVLPEDQTCCGALQTHAGWVDEGDRLLAQNRAAFKGLDAQAIVVNAAGCGAQLSAHLWSDESEVPIVDVSQWLFPRLIQPPRHKLPEKTTYDAPCHLHHAQGVHDAPYRLLETACERLVPLPEAEVCCGSAGLYSVEHNEMSRQVLARKIVQIESLGPDAVITGNPGCQMQLQAGLREAGSAVGVYHTIQVLDAAYRLETPYREAFNLPEGDSLTG